VIVTGSRSSKRGVIREAQIAPEPMNRRGHGISLKCRESHGAAAAFAPGRPEARMRARQKRENMSGADGSRGFAAKSARKFLVRKFLGSLLKNSSHPMSGFRLFPPLPLPLNLPPFPAARGRGRGGNATLDFLDALLGRSDTRTQLFQHPPTPRRRMSPARSSAGDSKLVAGSAGR
jgi:hypothetical protein